MSDPIIAHWVALAAKQVMGPACNSVYTLCLSLLHSSALLDEHSCLILAYAMACYVLHVPECTSSLIFISESYSCSDLLLFATSIAMSKNLINSVPEFDGTNHKLWSNIMQAFLQFQILWRVVDGSYTRPPVAGTGTAVEQAAKLEMERKWLDQNESAMGFIKMKMVPSLLHHAQPNFTARQLWDELKTAYATPGAATVFADFHKAIRFQLQSEADAAGNIPPHP